MGLEELKAQRRILSDKTDHTLDEMKAVAIESKRISEVAHSSSQLIAEIDEQFERVTSLDNSDVAFLFFAVMLQTLRWIMLPELKIPRMDELELTIDKGERLASNERNHVGGIYDGKKSGAEYELEELAKFKEKHADIWKKSQKEFYDKQNEYRSWIEILTQPVPYDAMNALDRKDIPNIAGLNKQNKQGFYNNIYGKNHHVATLGHDPILGWIFGTANIMTNTISFVDFQSYDVKQGHKVKSSGEFLQSHELQFSDQAIDYSSPRSLFSILSECVLSTEEDYKRIAAAVVKQAIHFASDKYCVEGLPIPLISVISPEKAQELIEKGWNSIEFKELLKNDLKQIGLSAVLSMMINLVIESIYLFCFDSDVDIEIRKIKIKRILSISQIMSSSSTVLYVALTKNTAKLDVGGITTAMITLAHSKKFMQEMKQEYIRDQFASLVMEDFQKEECNG